MQHKIKLETTSPPHKVLNHPVKSTVGVFFLILLVVSVIMVVTEVGKKCSFKDMLEAATDTILACYVQRPFLHI
jgi:hypothetical protein